MLITVLLLYWASAPAPDRSDKKGKKEWLPRLRSRVPADDGDYQGPDKEPTPAALLGGIMHPRLDDADPRDVCLARALVLADRAPAKRAPRRAELAGRNLNMPVAAPRHLHWGARSPVGVRFLRER